MSVVCTIFVGLVSIRRFVCSIWYSVQYFLCLALVGVEVRGPKCANCQMCCDANSTLELLYANNYTIIMSSKKTIFSTNRNVQIIPSCCRTNPDPMSIFSPKRLPNDNIRMAQHSRKILSPCSNYRSTGASPWLNALYRARNNYHWIRDSP